MLSTLFCLISPSAMSATTCIRRRKILRRCYQTWRNAIYCAKTRRRQNKQSEGRHGYAKSQCRSLLGDRWRRLEKKHCLITSAVSPIRQWSALQRSSIARFWREKRQKLCRTWRRICHVICQALDRPHHKDPISKPHDSLWDTREL